MLAFTFEIIPVLAAIWVCLAKDIRPPVVVLVLWCGFNIVAV